MKKTIVSMMLAVALLAGGTVYAQTDATTGATTQKENVKKDKKGNKGFKANKGNMSSRFNPFDGVQLTDDQQQRLQVLQQGLGPVQLSPEQQAKIPENKNLTPEQKKQLKNERKAKKQEAKKNYLNGVKEILTPDQYVIFLENCYLYTPQDQGKNKGFRPSDGARNHRSDKGTGSKANKEKKDKKK